MLIMINVKRIEFLNIVGGHLSHSHKSWKKNIIKQLSWTIIDWKLFRIWTLWLLSSKLNLIFFFYFYQRGIKFFWVWLLAKPAKPITKCSYNKQFNILKYEVLYIVLKNEKCKKNWRIYFVGCWLFCQQS